MLREQFYQAGIVCEHINWPGFDRSQDLPMVVLDLETQGRMLAILRTYDNQQEHRDVPMMCRLNDRECSQQLATLNRRQFEALGGDSPDGVPAGRREDR
jgi:hypothetical protein